MSETERLEVSHNPGLNRPSIHVTITADYGRWGEARTLRKVIKGGLRDGRWK